MRLIDIIRLSAYEGVPSTFRESIRNGNIISASTWNLISFVLPIMAFSSATIKNDKRVICFILAIVITMFFSKGVNPPVGWTYLWLYNHVPILAFFRHPSHLLFIISLSYSILIGIVFQKLIMIIKLKLHTHLTYVSALIFILIICISSWPVFTGDFDGSVQTYEPKASYVGTYDYLLKSNDSSKVAWLPITSALFYADSKFVDTTRDPMIVYSPKPAIDADTRTYHKFYAFTHMVTETTRTRYLADLLRVGGVKYVITRENVRSRYSNTWNQTIFLDGQSDFELLKKHEDVCIYKNKEYNPLIYASDVPRLVSGDFSTLVTLPYFFDIKKDDISTLFFSSQQSSDQLETLVPLIDQVVINNDGYYDYVFSNISTEYKFDPSRYATGWNPYLGWSPYYYNWGIDQEEVNSLGTGVITLATDSFVVPFYSAEMESYELWIKINIGENGGNLSFSLDNDKSFSTIATKSEYAIGLNWINLVTTQLNEGIHFLNITSEEGMNIVDTIVVMPSNYSQEAFEIANRSLQNRFVTFIYEFEWIGGNEYLIPAQKWGFNASNGVVLESTTPTEFTGSFAFPNSGNYTVKIITDDLLALSRLKINENSTNSKFQDKKNIRIGNLVCPTNWNSVNANVSSFHERLGERSYSSNFSFCIDKSKNQDHWIYKNCNIWDLSDYDAVGFWIYPKTNASSDTSEIFFHLRNSANEWYGTNVYLKNNEWNFVYMDITDWENRSEVSLIRLLVGGGWSSYDDEQQINFFIDDSKAFDAENGDLQQHYILDVYMGQGSNNLQFIIDRPHISLDIIALENSNINISATTTTIYNIFAHLRSTPKQHSIPINLPVETPRLINRMASSNPSFHPHGCTYNPSISNSTLEITTFFDGPEKEQEYVDVKELIHEIPINEYQNVSISHKVDDPDVQIIKMGFKVKNESGTVTMIWKTLEPHEEWHTYKINLYDTILRTYPDEAYTLSEIIIVPSKMWGFDCSGDKKGAYTYYIKDLSVSKSVTIIENPIVQFKIEDTTFKTEVNSTSFEWIKIGDMYLESGEHNVIWKGAEDVEIDGIKAVPKGQLFNPEDYSDEPSIVFQKINPTKYKVHVSTDEPFFLVFSESYHPQWKAYLDKKSFEFNDIIASYDNVDVKEAKHEMKFTPGDISYLFADPISDDKHFIVNGYANSWYIEETGEYDLTLYFLPQSLFYLGLFISGGTLIGCIGYLLRDWRRKDE
ncbi:MAG: hypothetical protein SVO01_00855 [Thermotogota bacterium]|nr:hypothetical protein [Thermotogota bacterium]